MTNSNGSWFANLQKNNRLQKANGLNLKFGGASYNSLMAGQVMGYSVHTQFGSQPSERTGQQEPKGNWEGHTRSNSGILLFPQLITCMPASHENPSVS